MQYNKGFNNIDLVYYINLDHRKDRFEHINNELNKTNIDSEKVNRISAIYIKNLGSLGCTKSHILALETFLNSSTTNKYCLILEDDFKFIQPQNMINEVLDKIFNEIYFDVLMLASNIIEQSETGKEFITKIINAQTTSGYIVNRNFAHILLDNYKKSEFLLEIYKSPHHYSIDMFSKLLQRDSQWYCVNPKIGKQIESYSDIEETITNYNS